MDAKRITACEEVKEALANANAYIRAAFIAAVDCPDLDPSVFSALIAMRVTLDDMSQDVNKGLMALKKRAYKGVQ